MRRLGFALLGLAALGLLSLGARADEIGIPLGVGGLRTGGPGRVETVAAGTAIAAAPSPTADLVRPERDYWVYVCSESEDEVSLVRFGPSGVFVEKTIPVGSFPADIEGPHGIAVSPNGRFWYVSISHGQPFGTIHKFRTGTDEWEGDVRVGMFPATLDVSGTTGLLYVVNADFYGDHEPSTISVIETSTMTEVAQIPTGAMPHGARMSRDGRFFYSVNMMDDELVEVDALRFEVRRRLKLRVDDAAEHDPHAHHSSGAVAQPAPPTEPHHRAKRIEPAWVTAPTAGGKVWVTGLSGNTLFEVDLASFEVVRRFADTWNGPYNADVTPDESLLVVTYKRGDAVGFWDLASGTEVARIPTTRRVPHGVVITPDGHYSFVTVEGVGGEPGVVEIYDNAARRRVDTIEVGKQAGGIALWERGR
jgi:DNA-binding beta-propeller fold protein YncE